MNIQQEIVRALIRGLAYNITSKLRWEVALVLLVLLFLFSLVAKG